MNDENLIYVLNKSLALHQITGGFKTSMDSVMLAAACPAKKGQSILDLGCGVGSAGFCVLKRIPETKLHGVDIQQDHIDLAVTNAQKNNMAERSNFSCADVRSELDIGSFNHVICNPPYKEAGAHRQSPSPAKARAMGHLEENLNLQSWTTRAWHHIKGQGSLTMVHEAGQTDRLIQALYSENGGRRFGSVEIIPLYPKAGTAAKRVIIRAYKHKKSPATLHQGIVMHDQNGQHTKEADDILRHAAPL